MPEVKLKSPPKSEEAEKSALGSVIIDRNAIFKVADILEPGDFYKPSHQEIYSSILDLFHQSEPIDLTNLTNRLKEKNKLEEVGGLSYISELANSVPSPGNIVSYAKTIKRKRVLRDLISASYEIESLGWKEDTGIDEVLDEAEQKIFGISKSLARQEFIHLKEEIQKTVDRINLSHQQGGILRGISTSFPELDHILSGLQKSDLIILAARPSIGKTSLVLDIARNIALRNKQPVGIFSLEMSRDQLIERLIAAESGIDLWKLRSGRLSSQGEITDFDIIKSVTQKLIQAPIYLNDEPILTVTQMRTLARRLQAETNLGLLVVDYLQLIRPRNERNGMVQQVTEISRGLKALARELNIPVIAVSQLSRAVEQRDKQIPRLSDLRESGSIEQDADVVMFIYREDRVKDNSSRPNIADIIIAKHRNGPLGRIPLVFHEHCATFRPLEKEEMVEEEEL